MVKLVEVFVVGAVLTACSVKPVSYTPIGSTASGPGDAGVLPIDASAPAIDASAPPGAPPPDAPPPPPPPQPSCTDGKRNGNETDVDCGGDACPACGVSQACAIDRDCANGSVCGPTTCRFASSCAEIIDHHPAISDGVYTIASMGTTFDAVCDMSFDSGGWTLLLKANGDSTLDYNASAWTDTNLLNETDLTTASGNAKYQSFLSLPITKLRGELDGYNYTQPVASSTAVEIFNSQSNQLTKVPFTADNFNIANWPTQPFCQTFGINLPMTFAGVRFGWSANENAVDDCSSSDTGIGLGLVYTDSISHGAGRFCQFAGCELDSSPDLTSDVPGNGLLWGR